MGKSECESQLPLPRTTDQKVTAANPVEEQVTFTVKAALHHNKGMIPPKGIHLVCGDKAYPYLPKGWAGSCYLASVFPEARFKTHLHDSDRRLRKREIVLETIKGHLGVLQGRWWEKGFGAILPGAGTIMNSDRIDKLSLALEYVANVSIAYYAELTAMLVSMRTMVMKNWVALDFLLTEKGGSTEWWNENVVSGFRTPEMPEIRPLSD